MTLSSSSPDQLAATVRAEMVTAEFRSAALAELTTRANNNEWAANHAARHMARAEAAETRLATLKAALNVLHTTAAQYLDTGRGDIDGALNQAEAALQEETP